MKVKVLGPALEDLSAGRSFYDQQKEGIGDYFFDSVFAEIDSLALPSQSLWIRKVLVEGHP